MTNLSKFHIVFSSSGLICINKYAFEGYLCLTINTFVKQNKSSLLSPLRKRQPPQLISILEILEYLVYLLLTNLAALPCSLSTFTVVLLVWVPDSGAILHKRVNQRKVSCLLKLLWAALHDAFRSDHRYIPLGVTKVSYHQY